MHKSIQNTLFAPVFKHAFLVLVSHFNRDVWGSTHFGDCLMWSLVELQIIA